MQKFGYFLHGQVYSGLIINYLVFKKNDFRKFVRKIHLWDSLSTVNSRKKISYRQGILWAPQFKGRKSKTCFSYPMYDLHTKDPETMRKILHCCEYLISKN
jgi:hypothetical protein